MAPGPRFAALFVLLLASLLLFAPRGSTLAQSAAPATPAIATLPHVHFLATGGTISNRNGGRLTAEELTKSMPGVERYARVTYEQFANVASSELTLDQWLSLSKRVNEVFATDKEVAGIVVTSGTDTLEETAFFLHLTVRDPRPVVVVGSMRNPSTLGYEGAANLLEGVRVAADPNARDQGALVVLNDEINSARNVTKTDALRLQTFRSREHGVLGVVDADRVVFFSQIAQRHNARVEFDIGRLTTLPRVDIILVYQGASGDLIKAAVDSGAKGLVMATAGAGATSGTQNEGLTYRRAKRDFHRDDYEDRVREDCASTRESATAGQSRAGNHTAATSLHDRRRRPHAGEGPRAADARTHADQQPRRDPAHFQ